MISQTDPAVRVDGLAKAFEGETVLNEFNITVPEGEITLVMGPNGVGKTILLSCIAGGLHPDSGKIEVFEKSPAEAKADLSFMLQDGLLVDELTGRENIEFFQDLHPAGTDQWRSILDELEFDPGALGREVRDYSGGMKRKLELAIALSADVPLYLLDEPTAALDITTVDTLHSQLADRRQGGATVLMSSHLPKDADLADYLVFIGPGGVIATGRPEQMLDTVPKVARVEGRTEVVTEFVHQETLFETGQERRGFLDPGVDPAVVEDASDSAGTQIRVTEPTVIDLFNYYIHIRGSDARPTKASKRGSAGGQQ